MTKAEFLGRLQRTRSEWDRVIAQVATERMEQPGVAGDWSLKDVIAHVAWHEREMVGMIAARALVGSALWNLPLHQRNAIIYEQNRYRRLSDVLVEEPQSFQKLVEGIETLSDDDLSAASHFPGMPADWLPWQVIAGNCYEHYSDHLAGIRAWLEQGKHE